MTTERPSRSQWMRWQPERGHQVGGVWQGKDRIDSDVGWSATQGISEN